MYARVFILMAYNVQALRWHAFKITNFRSSQNLG